MNYEVWTKDGVVEYSTKTRMLTAVFYLVKRRGEAVRIVNKKTNEVATLNPDIYVERARRNY